MIWVFTLVDRAITYILCNDLGFSVASLDLWKGWWIQVFLLLSFLTILDDLGFLWRCEWWFCYRIVLLGRDWWRNIWTASNIYLKKKKRPNPRLENWPDYRLDFLGRVGLKAAKPDFYQVGFQIIVNPTQPNISPSHQFAKICLDSCNSEMAVCCVPCQSKPKNLVDLCF